MAVPEGLRPLSRKLNIALRKHTSIYALGTARSPLWYGRMLTSLVLLTDGEEIEYVTGTYRADKHEAQVAVFTPSLVIDARATGIDGDDAEMTVCAVARSAILSLATDADETVFSDSLLSQWPGALVVTATYTGLPEALTLPLETLQSDDKPGPVRNLLTSLKEDLRAASRRA